MASGTGEADYDDLSGCQLDHLDSGGSLLVRNYWGGRLFIERYKEMLAQAATDADDAVSIFIHRTVPSLKALGEATVVLKRLVHSHAYAMAITPLIERLGCRLNLTHIDCGVIRYQMLGGLRAAAQSSGFFLPEDFVRPNPKAIPEIFGHSRVPPHRDVRWPHIRMLGLWMPLVDLEEGEALTLLPDVFSSRVVCGDPSNEPFPAVSDPSEFGLGQAYSPAMQAGDVLVFHAAAVHSSPVRQAKTLRASIDSRVAYPCFDDFEHYKSTFVQGRNLIHDLDEAGPVSEVRQRSAFESFVRTLSGAEPAAPSSMRERRILWERRGAIPAEEIEGAVATAQFCPDTYLWMLARTDSQPACERLLQQFLVKESSYFWLLQAYLAAKARQCDRLTQPLHAAAVQACQATTLPIRNMPFEWPGPARELSPGEALKYLEETAAPSAVAPNRNER